MWKGVDCTTAPATCSMVISALELFVAERPDDGQTPDALLRLGRAYQAAGCSTRRSALISAISSAIRRAWPRRSRACRWRRRYIAKGPELYARPRSVLLEVRGQQPVHHSRSRGIPPGAVRAGAALLSHRPLRRSGRAARRDDRSAIRDDARMAQLLFLMADSYRKSAGLLN